MFLYIKHTTWTDLITLKNCQLLVMEIYNTFLQKVIFITTLNKKFVYKSPNVVQLSYQLDLSVHDVSNSLKMQANCQSMFERSLYFTVRPVLV